MTERRLEDGGPGRGSPASEAGAPESPGVRVPASLELVGLHVDDEIRPQADLALLLVRALEDADRQLATDDVIVVAQKAVSKAEGRLVALDTVEPSAFARQLGFVHGRDARLIELVLRESRRIVRMERGIIIAETHHGFVCANAGIDLSNVSGGDVACLLPEDPDRSAWELRGNVAKLTGIEPGIVISDTFGRPWRTGATNVALGVAGLDALRSHVGERDPYGYELRVTEVAIADEIAGAAELVMGKTDRRPFVLVRGPYPRGTGSARDLIRDAATDMFR
jgi:coenzyme F420-0:L-glutamate ligase/coenzyme F420-1:gamma-L-glutamate ligase